MFAWYVSGEGVAMRKAGLVVGLLLCASFEARAEAKRREPPTRSQALAACQALTLKGDPTCRKLIEQGEAAFLAGRWHPSQGPFRAGTDGIGFWADCGDTATGTSFGSWYGVQCGYLSNIDKDPEFPVFVREREAAKQREEEERRERRAEKARDYKAETVAALEQTLSKALESIPGSVGELRTAVVKDAVDLYQSARAKLNAADLIVQGSPLTLGDHQTAEYKARIRALRERNAAVGQQFALQESESLRKLTAARLRRYSLPQLAAQTRVCESVLAVAGDSLAALSPDGDPRERLEVASERASRCLAECEEATPRAAEIHALQIILCVDYPRAQQALAEEVRRKNEIDRASGTRNLALDRELAEQKIMLREERDAAIRRLKQLGAPYSKSKCRTLE